jgi:hypothetical protein
MQGINYLQFKNVLIDKEFGTKLSLRMLNPSQMLRSLYGIESEVELFMDLKTELALTFAIVTGYANFTSGWASYIEGIALSLKCLTK